MYMKNIFLSMAIVLAALLLPGRAAGQGMALNTTSAAADASAMLDVTSTTQGVLVPRMTASQRTSISSPANGLLVYQTDGTTGFYYNSGSASSPSWTSLSGGGGVTSLSSGNLTPLFTTSVTNATTTPAITYSLTGASAFSVLTNSTSSTAAPVYGKVHPVALLNTGGTASSSTFYRGDGQWATPTSSGGQMVFSAQVLTSNASTTFYPTHLNGNTVQTSPVDITGTVMPVSGTVDGLYVGGWQTAGSSGGTITVTLYRGTPGSLSSTGITVSLTTSGTSTFISGSSSSTTSFSAGDYLAYVCTNSATGNVTHLSISLHAH